MVEIPVERKGTPWWIFALLLVLGVVVIWALVRDRGETEMAAVPPVGTTDMADRTEVPAEIVNLETIWNTTNVDALDGKPVQISDARVLSVTGDNLFWVGTDRQHQVLVALQEEPTPNQPATEGRYDVNPGQVVTIYGTVHKYPGFDQARQMWNADPALRQEFDAQRVYLKASRLDITHRP